MIKQPRFKIALVGDQLSGGGAERVQAQLSFYFDSKNIEVHHIIVQDVVTYEFAGTLFNMGKLKDTTNGIANKWFRFKALKNYLAEHQFDFIIDFRVKNKFLQEYYIANVLYKAPFIMTIRSYDTSFYFPKRVFLAKRIYQKAYGIVTVSNLLKDKIITDYGYKNVQAIYNPVKPAEIQEKSKVVDPFDFPYIFGIGRMHEIKQFDHLIHAFDRSSAKERGFKLVLMGDGALKSDLQNLVQRKNIEKNVVFMEYQENPFPYFRGAHLTALTSKNEGFPNILIESLACETPVVAYDCESGPAEIIIQNENGILVENQNLDAMTRAIETMITDAVFYKHCKSMTLKSIERFDFETIGKQWLNFLNIPVD